MGTTDKQSGSLSRQKRELLALMLKDRGLNTGLDASAASIPVCGKAGPLPLSYGQQQLWFLEQLESGTAAYVFTNAVHLNGPLNVKALEQALNLIIKRHAILRTRHTSDNGRPAQVIMPELELALHVDDLRSLADSEKRSRADELTRVEGQTPFDIANEALIRVKLLRLEDRRHTMLLTLHHIVYDGWSLAIFFRELGDGYRAYAHGKTPVLPELSIQYADYAKWQRDRINNEASREQLEYWKRKLGGALPVLSLPTDRPRPSVQRYNGALQPLALPVPLMEALAEFSQREGCTVFMTLLAAFKVLLRRYSNQEDIIVGSPVAGRTRPETETLIGFFVNTLVLRTDLSNDPTFRGLLSQVRETALGAFSHQEVPFEKLVEALHPARDLSYNPIYQVMFALQNTPAPSGTIGDLSMRLEEVDSSTSLFDLTLSLWETTDGLKGWFEYSTDLFNRDTIVRMGEHFRSLLEGILADPEQRISRLALLTEKERHKILVDWNDTGAAVANPAYVHHSIEKQARDRAASIAVTSQGKQLSYAELNRKANQLAHFLKKQGVQPGSLIALCTERSPEMIVAILGIIKAGAAYVPLDPAYPRERLAFMLEDTQAPILLTQKKLLAGLPPHQARVFCLDGDWDTIAKEKDHDPDVQLSPDNLVYVIYTSGSTGKPKGVLVTHGNLAHSIAARATYYPGTVRGFVLLSSFAFDSSVAGIFWTLCQGGALLLPEQGAEQEPERIAEAVHAIKASHILCLPSVYQLLLRHTSPRLLSSLNTVIVAGEPCPITLMAQHRQHLPGTRVYNEYGPTEAAVWSTVYEIPADTDQHRVPIGRPIPNAQVYILDANLQPVPIGVAGEVYIGGPGVARGYLNRPDLTSEKFVANPFKHDTDERLYRTGDLARYLADGNIDFLGRIDHQVKIRGYRIELGEIETALRRHAAISEAVMVAREDSKSHDSSVSGSKRLVGYAVATSAQRPSPSELRDFLKASLPDYMIPSIIVLLDEMPLTPNGKIDLKALPDPDRLRSGSGNTFAEPTNETERKLAEIWSEVLGQKTIGIHDNFFEVGGDSILSILIIARAKQAGIHITPRQVFQYSTIAELATVAGAATEIKMDQGLVSGEFPLTPIQRWFFDQEMPNPHHWNQPAMLLVPDDLDLELLHGAFERLMVHHDILRARFSRDGEGWKQEIAETATAPEILRFDFSGLSESQRIEAITSAVTDLQSGLDITQGRIIRVAHFALSPGQHGRLCVVPHHLVMDGVSWRILLEDLGTAYRQLKQGHAIRLPAKTTSYKTWAEHLTRYADSMSLRAELDFWTQEAASKGFSIPTDFHGGDNTVASEQKLRVVLTAEETQTLLKRVPPVYNTQIDDLLLTAMATTFSRWTGSDTLALSMEGHGREIAESNIDLTRTVGWFTSHFPVRLTLNSKHSGDTIKSIKEQLRRVPNRGIGFAVLRYLCPDSAVAGQLRSANQSPVLYNYLGQFNRSESSDSFFGLTSESCGPDHDPAGPRSHLLEINAMVFDDRLHIDWVYSENLHAAASIQRLADEYMETLRNLISHCLSSEAGGFSPSDFPEANLDQAGLDDLLRQLNQP